MPHNLFKDLAEAHNGRKIGLIWAAGTRMGGFFYCFHRLLHLRVVLKAVVITTWIKKVEFEKKNSHFKDLVEKIAGSDELFEAITIVVKMLWPVIKCILLSDSNSPGMDKIWFFVRQTTFRLKDMVKEIDDKVQSIDLDRFVAVDPRQSTDDSDLFDKSTTRTLGFSAKGRPQAIGSY